MQLVQQQEKYISTLTQLTCTLKLYNEYSAK